MNKCGKSQHSLVHGSQYTVYFNRKCLAKKNLPLLGWGGLTQREAARGVFQLLDSFQNMDDPLEDPDPQLGPVMKEVDLI